MNSKDRLSLERFRVQCANEKLKREASHTILHPSKPLHHTGKGNDNRYGDQPTDKPFVRYNSPNNPTQYLQTDKPLIKNTSRTPKHGGHDRFGDRTPYEKQLTQYHKDLAKRKKNHHGSYPNKRGGQDRFGDRTPYERQLTQYHKDLAAWKKNHKTPFNPYVDANLPQDIPAVLAFNNPSNIGKTLMDMFPSPKPTLPITSFLGVPVPPPDIPVAPTPPTQQPIDTTGPAPPPAAPLGSACPSFHPSNSIPSYRSQADTVNAITAYVNSKGYRHDPDGIPWIPRGNWIPWDGVTTYNPCTSTTAQLMAGIFPTGVNTMRGLRERFYQVNPFADNTNPTVAEIENWNVEIIRLFRQLLGFTQANNPVNNDKCTYLKAAWADQRLHTTYWDASYPGTLDGASGPCTQPTSSNAHCGASFLPNGTDQTPYLCPSSMPACSVTSGAEGISNHNTDIPWGIKMGRVIGTYLSTDGIGAHTGPFVSRPQFGTSWYINPTNQASVSVRTKWSGPLGPTCP